MKKISMMFLAIVMVTAVKAQTLQGDSTFRSTENQLISVKDTLLIGVPAAGQAQFLFIEDLKDKNIKKASNMADKASAVGSVVGLGGIRGALTGLKIGRAANKISTVAGAASILNGNGIIKPGDVIIITKLYQDKSNEIIAEATSMTNHKYILKINQALLLKEVVPQIVNANVDGVATNE